MRRLISRPLALLGSALMIVGMASVAAPASADAGKYYTATVGPSSLFVGPQQAVTVTVTNQSSQGLGALRVVFPAADTTLEWPISGVAACTITRVNTPSKSCIEEKWTPTPVDSNGTLTVTVQTPSSSGAQLGVGDSIAISATPAFPASTVSSTLQIPIGTTAKQSNNFNDTGDGNLLQLSGDAPSFQVKPSAYCNGKQTCALSLNEGNFKEVAVGHDAGATYGVVTIRPDDTLYACAGASGRPAVDVNDGSSLLDKSVQLSWSAGFTSLSGISSKKWPVCMTAPYPIEGAPGTLPTV
ncbi:MAG: hypothetical protein ACTHMW_08440, partial [Actinomycetes bacterium]